MLLLLLPLWTQNWQHLPTALAVLRQRRACLPQLLWWAQHAMQGGIVPGS
jgi:hypothetical protein